MVRGVESSFNHPKIQSQKMSKNATATKWGFRRFNGQTKTRGNCVWKGVKRGIQEATRYLLHERQWFNQESKKTDYPKREDALFWTYQKRQTPGWNGANAVFLVVSAKSIFYQRVAKQLTLDLLICFQRIIFSTHLEPGNSWRPSKYFFSYLEDHPI